MNQNKIPKFELLALIIGEIAVSAVIAAVYLIIEKFNYTVILGVLLGSFITVLNFVILSISVNRAIDRAIEGADMPRIKRAYEERDAAEAKKDSENDTESEASETPEYELIIREFEKDRQAGLNSALKLSYIIRNAIMIVSLVLAFISRQFDVIATVIPLLLYRPILTVAGLCRRKEN